MMSKNSTLRCPASTIYSTALATSPDIASSDSCGLSRDIASTLLPAGIEGGSRAADVDLGQSRVGGQWASQSATGRDGGATNWKSEYEAICVPLHYPTQCPLCPFNRGQQH